QAEDGIRDFHVTGVQTCALPISSAQARATSSGDSVAFTFTSNSLCAGPLRRASWCQCWAQHLGCQRARRIRRGRSRPRPCPNTRSEEHTSELQSREKLVCRLLLE